MKNNRGTAIREDVGGEREREGDVEGKEETVRKLERDISSEKKTEDEGTLKREREGNKREGKEKGEEREKEKEKEKEK